MAKDFLSVALHEHAQINKKIDDFINAQFIYISTILTLGGSFIVLATQTEGIEWIEPIVPYLPYIFIIMGPTFLYKFNRAIVLHGYRRFLEDVINKKIDKNLLSGAHLVKEKLLERNWFTIMNYSVLGAFVLTTVYICHMDQIFVTNFNLWIQLLIILLGVGIFVKRNLTAYNSGYILALSRYENDSIEYWTAIKKKKKKD